MLRRVALRLVKDELDRAFDQHPKFSSTHEGYAVLLEEVDELWDEIKSGNGTTHRGISEAVQTAAMALRYLIDLCEEDQVVEHEKKIERHQLLSEQYTGTSFGGYSG